MAKGTVRPVNAPSTTGKPSGLGRGNNSPAKGKTSPLAPKKGR